MRSHPIPRVAVVSHHDCDLDAFRELVETEVDAADYPHSSGVQLGALVYESDRLRNVLATDADAVGALRNELTRAIHDGPGIIVLTGAIDLDVIDRASAAFERIIAAEREAGRGAGDHYAKPGANERVWNALEKLAVEDPAAFVDYYASDMIDLVSLAWLGPGYKISSQVNVVNPGGEAQMPHRDYHIGFMTDEVAEQYPRHAHRLSPVLTLQGAVAHCDMPVDSGPTMYLPHSHKYELGYLAWRRSEFIEHFEHHHVQLPLAKGDLVFFSPAMFHGAGANRTTDVRRMANLLQIGSAMGCAMETIDRERLTNAIYPTLLRRQAEGMDPVLVGCAVAAGADGYAFPTNLDRDPPLDGLTPPSQQDLVFDALRTEMSPAELAERLAEHTERRRSH